MLITQISLGQQAGYGATGAYGSNFLEYWFYLQQVVNFYLKCLWTICWTICDKCLCFKFHG
jgi:hypothetical protein